MPKFTVTASKSSPDTKVGLVFVKLSSSTGLFVKTISPDGLFASSDLNVYDEVLTINGTKVYNMKGSEAAKMVKTIEGDMTIEARRPHAGAVGAITFMDLKSIEVLNVTDMKNGIKQSRDTVPLAGVPLKKWQRIYDAIQNGMVPPTKKTLLLHSVEGHSPFLSQQAASAAMVASDVQAMANILLVPHGFMARKVMKDYFKTKTARCGDETIMCDNYVCFGLKFVPIEENTDEDVNADDKTVAQAGSDETEEFETAEDGGSDKASWRCSALCGASD
eukprot:CAMPEP_0194204246 /NCGR_PEP_ID=MMETSP0156-20130528/3830_1 /TAXON_ID=33649 /ORGANISM="Thalassionema nitzschioides, Strain L26-B" /LENGTH=275 /DNA_ID=CAMNT_0038930217 /DNA_START=45 /DNA_END=872 /DNA_ORIENTATION=+